MPKPLLQTRLSARDRRIAAIHEAGHVTMARHVGLAVVSAWLEETSNPGNYDKLWIGHTRYFSPSISEKKMSRRKLAMFAVAGAVGEFCWQRETFDETLDMWLEEKAMSETDWAACACEPGNPSPQLLIIIKTVFSLFDREAGELWPTVMIEARSLMKYSRDAAGNARKT